MVLGWGCLSLALLPLPGARVGVRVKLSIGSKLSRGKYLRRLGGGLLASSPST